MKSIISTLDAESGVSRHGGLRRSLPICRQLVEVTLTLSGDLGFPVLRGENLQPIEELPLSYHQPGGEVGPTQVVRSERPAIQLQRPNAVINVKRLCGDEDQIVHPVVLQASHAGLAWGHNLTSEWCRWSGDEERQLVHDPHVPLPRR